MLGMRFDTGATVTQRRPRSSPSAGAGAVGGSALRHFARVTADWATATVVFEK